MMQKKWAFTLAEVMITMTIVGVVAALTIPTLNYNRVKKEYSAKLKNFYSKMDNAVLDMQMDKGSFKDMILPTQGNGFDWYMENIDPYMGHQFVDTATKQVYYKDGSKLGTFFTGGCLDVIYDVNGDKSPNSEGYDQYRFLYCFNKDGRRDYFGSEDIFFGVYGSGITSQATSRQAMIDQCVNNRSSCTRLLQNDQWEFKSDYPIKF